MTSSDAPLAASRIVVFDTETTGLSPTIDHVIEIAALAVENGVETGRFESLIDPGVPIPPEVTAIHGITDDMVRGQPRFPEVARRFMKFSGDSILAAHNAPYDISMMIVPMVAAGLIPSGNLVLDTCRLSRRLIPAANHKLSTVAKALGIEMPRAHRAMADVEACAGVLRALIERLGAGATLADAEKAAEARLEFGISVDRLADSPPALKPLVDAIRSGANVNIVYRGGSHGDAPRLITPLFLLELDGALNVSAQCHLTRELKNFRVDRIAAARPPQES